MDLNNASEGARTMAKKKAKTKSARTLTPEDVLREAAADLALEKICEAADTAERLPRLFEEAADLYQRRIFQLETVLAFYATAAPEDFEKDRGHRAMEMMVDRLNVFNLPETERKTLADSDRRKSLAAKSKRGRR